MMYSSLKKLYLEFSSQEKRRLFVISVVIVITALVQVVGIASIFPFISAASNPDTVDTNVYLSSIKSFLGIEDNRHFIVLLGFVVLAVLVITNLFLAFSTWVTMRFLVTLNNTLALRLLQKYLSENYLFHLTRNSAELLKNINSETNRVVNGGIMSAINIVSKLFTTVCILLFLIAVDPLAALIVGLVLGISYLLIYWSIRLKLSRIGVIVTRLFSDRMRYMNESLGGIKELKVLGREHYYLKKFHEVSQEIIQHQVFNRAAIDLPKFLLETIAFGGILALTIYLVAFKNQVETILPMISLYAFAGYRLMPALQGIFQSTATLRHDIAAVDLFYDDIKDTQTMPSDSEVEEVEEVEITEQMHLTNEIKLDQLNFSYPNTQKKAISNLSLTIKANTSIGVVGTSGSGKSTLVDIILGLLECQNGQILVDGNALSKMNLRSWQNTIGYVPQVIFLADSTISENIAFGIPAENIEQAAVETAAKMANLHQFIVEELEQGYDTIVGERGIRLSGGQRQRIGIARALYHNPSVLILDEATSALDTPTEKAVMEAVYNLAHKKTIIMIAHRISTIQECDQIIMMEHGQIVDSGSFESLVISNDKFRKIAKSHHG